MTDSLKTVPWPKITLLFVVSRVLIGIGIILSSNKFAVEMAMKLFRWVFFAPDPEGRIAAYHPLFLHSHAQSLQDISRYWDGFWYLRLAQHGYTFNGAITHQTVAHYPFFSLVCSWAGHANTSAILWTGIILNNLCFLASLGLLFWIVKKYAGETIALSAAILLALYPGSLYFSLFLTESFYLFFCLAFFYLLEQKRYWLAALISWPASLTRYSGLFLSVNFLNKKNWPLFLLAVAAVAIYPLYLGATFHEPLLYVKLQTIYRGAGSFIKLGLFFTVCMICVGISWVWPRLKAKVIWTLLILIPLVIYLIMSFLAVSGKSAPPSVIPVHEMPGFVASLFAVIVFGLLQHKLPINYKIFAALHVAAILYAQTFICNQRYVAVIFPLFWMLACGLVEHGKLKWLCYGLSSLALVGLTILFVSMGWLFVF